MNQEKDIWDIVESGSTLEVIGVIKSYISLIDQHFEFIRANLDKAARNLVLCNLLLKLKGYLSYLMYLLDGPTELIGFTTRYLFELNLVTQYVLMSEENLKLFVAESAIDKIQILEGSLELRNTPYKLTRQNKKDLKVLEEEITRQKANLEKFNFPLKKPNSIIKIARMVGAELEYKALYKLCSKYIHPSSYSINIYEDVLAEDQLRTLFLAYALLYAGVMFQKVKEATMGDVV